MTDRELLTNLLLSKEGITLIKKEENRDLWEAKSPEEETMRQWFVYDTKGGYVRFEWV